jgi:hypothetical protein
MRCPAATEAALAALTDRRPERLDGADHDRLAQEERRGMMASLLSPGPSPSIGTANTHEISAKPSRQGRIDLAEEQLARTGDR